MIFDKNNNGAQELRELIGFIDASTNFNKWRTWLNLSKRQTLSILGNTLYKRVEDFYNSEAYGKEPTDANNEEKAEWKTNQELVHKFQLTISLFAFVKIIPSLDAGHGNGGRHKVLGENDRSLTAVEAYKDETNIQNLAYEALEDLINYCEENNIEEWEASELKKSTGELLIPNVSVFNLSYRINSSRLFFILVPMIKEVQDKHIIPILTRARFNELLGIMNKKEPTEEEKKLLSLLPIIRLPLALQTMALAFKRLSLEVLPEGIVQTQIVGTVKEKLAADERTRQSMIDSLSDDAKSGFTTLQEELAALYEKGTERYVTPPTAKEGVKGFLF